MRADIHRILAGQQVTAPMAPVGETQPMYGGPIGGTTVIEDPRPVAEPVTMGPDDGTTPPRKGRGFAYFLLGLDIVALAVGGYVLWGKLSGPTTSNTVAVPSLTNMTKDQAIAALREANLDLGDTSSRSSSTIAKDKVMGQDPTPQTQVAPGTKVNIVLSAGPAAIPVPDVDGKSVEEATRLLEAKNFKVEQKETNSRDEKGTV